MKILHPVFLIILFYMIAQTMITLTTTGDLEQVKTFLIGSLFLLAVITVLLIWTGELFMDYKKRKTE